MTDLQTLFDIGKLPEINRVTVSTRDSYNEQLEQIAAGLLANGMGLDDVTIAWHPNAPEPNTTVYVKGVVRYRVVLDAFKTD